MDLNVKLKQRLPNGDYVTLNFETLAELVKMSATDPTTIAEKLALIEAIAKGASVPKVFNTVAELDAWIGVAANKATLKVGDNLYIKAKDVPDYWWDGTAKQELEVQKIILSNATASLDGLMSKEDYTKLRDIAPNANNYTHPINHAATVITEDANHRFVTDQEKAEWKGKANITVSATQPANQNTGDMWFQIV